MINRRHVAAALVAFLISFGLSTAAFADVPATMTYHGNLADGSGQPVDTTVEATFRIYDAKAGGTEVWSEDFSTVDVNNGSFTAQLGSNQPLTGVFDGHQYWLEVTIDGETLSPRTAIDSVPYALRANTANDADTVGGKTPADLTASVPTTAADLAYDNSASGMNATDVQAALDELAQLRARVDALEARTQDANGDPINVADLDSRITQNAGDISSVQTAVSNNADDISDLQTTTSNNAGDISNLQSTVQNNGGDISNLQSSVQNNTSAISSLQTTSSNNANAISALQTSVSNNRGDIDTNTTNIQSNASAISQNAGTISTNTSDITTNAGDISNNAGDISTNAGNISANAGDITALQNLTQDMSRTTINGHPSVAFTGVNVHIRNGLGATDGDTGGGAQVNGLGNLIIGYDEARSSGSDKSGSHNLVLGSENNYTSYGGIVAGSRNEISGKYASVSGGLSNTASGDYASISGGSFSTASAAQSSVSGGTGNTASGFFSTVSGGSRNTATGWYSSVSGGYQNTASGQYASVSAGESNDASGQHTSITGGRSNTADWGYATVTGGENNSCSGYAATITGGNGNTTSGVDAVVP